MSNSYIKDYKDLIVWQKSVDLSVLVYQITVTFPKSELYGIVSQMRRCVVSIPSNIAEGSGRKLKSLDQMQFLRIAYGSAQEQETQLIISQKLGFITTEDFTKVMNLLNEVLKMLYTMILK